MVYSLFLRIFIPVTLLISLAVQADNSDLQQQIDTLNQKIAQLEQQTADNRQTLGNIVSDNLRNNVSFNGFASFGLSKTSDKRKDAPYYHGQSRDVSVTPNTWLGLRMDARLYQSGEIVAQVIASGNNNDSLDLKTEWLFLKQELGLGFNTHIGRIRFPVHIDSEVIYVGNVYPTVAPAAEIYSVLSMNHLDGISVNHALPLGEWTLDTKLILWGQANDPRDGHNIRLKEVQGTALSLSSDTLTVRVGLFTGKKIIQINEPARGVLVDPLDVTFSDRLDYLTAALRFDNQRLYFSAEGIAIHSRSNMLDEVHNWSTIAGFYIGSTLFYTGYSRLHVANTNELTEKLDNTLTPVLVNPGPVTVPAGQLFKPYFNRQQRNLQIGVKHDLTPSVVLKAQIQYLHDFEGTRGNFATMDVTRPQNHIYLYDLAIQAFF